MWVTNSVLGKHEEASSTPPNLIPLCTASRCRTTILIIMRGNVFIFVDRKGRLHRHFSMRPNLSTYSLFCLGLPLRDFFNGLFNGLLNHSISAESPSQKMLTDRCHTLLSRCKCLQWHNGGGDRTVGWFWIIRGFLERLKSIHVLSQTNNPADDDSSCASWIIDW